MNTSQTSTSIRKEVIELFGLAKLFFGFRRMKVSASGFSFISDNPRIYFVLSILFHFVWPAYAFILVVFVVPPPASSSIKLNPALISLKSLFGTGINLVGFFILLLFGFAFITSLLTLRTNFLNSPQASLLFSSPHSLHKLLAGEILSSSVYREYGISMMLVSFYFVYRIWVELPLNLVTIVMLIIFGVTLSLIGNLFGIIVGIFSLGDLKEYFFSKSFLVILTIVSSSVISFIVDIFLQQSLFQPFSPLGWITLGVYSLFSGNNPEFQLTIFFAVFILLIATFMVPSRLPGEFLQLKDQMYNKKPGFFQKSLTRFVSRLYTGYFRNLANIMLKEEWEKKRPLKFFTMAAVAVFFYLLFQPSIFRNFPPEIIIFATFGTFLFCLIAPLSRLIYQEFSYSLFNIDGRFLFYKSTPSGISEIAIMRLSFILIWEMPLIVITSIVAALVDPTWSMILWFSLAFSAVLLITSTNLLIQCLRPHYHLSSFFQIEDQLITMTLVATIILVLTLITSSVFLGVPELVIAVVLIIFAFLLSIISVQQGLRRLENDESLH